MRTEDDEGSDGDVDMTSKISKKEFAGVDESKCWSCQTLLFRTQPHPLTMATTTTDPAVQQVIQAIQVFSRAPDKKQLADANAWLQNFQHSVRICCREVICFTVDSGCILGPSLDHL